MERIPHSLKRSVARHLTNNNRIYEFLKKLRCRLRCIFQFFVKFLFLDFVADVVQKSYIMKILLTLFVLLFSSSVVAEDISDFQIEGMSIGDSLLDYFSEKEIIDEIEINKYMYEYTTDEFGEVYKYDGLQTYFMTFFFVKPEDKIL